jgi:hypothetical protein
MPLDTPYLDFDQLQAAKPLELFSYLSQRYKDLGPAWNNEQNQRIFNDPRALNQLWVDHKHKGHVIYDNPEPITVVPLDSLATLLQEIKKEKRRHLDPADEKEWTAYLAYQEQIDGLLDDCYKIRRQTTSRFNTQEWGRPATMATTPPVNHVDKEPPDKASSQSANLNAISQEITRMEGAREIPPPRSISCCPISSETPPEVDSEAKGDQPSTMTPE